MAKYTVPKGEENSYHCLIEVRQFDAKTGERISRPRIQKFGRKAFEYTVRDNLLKQGYTIEVLHSPADWDKQRAAEQEKEREAAEARRKEEFNAAVAEEVARILAAEREQSKAQDNGKTTGETKPNK